MYRINMFKNGFYAVLYKKNRSWQMTNDTWDKKGDQSYEVFWMPAHQLKNIHENMSYLTNTNTAENVNNEREN